jgi:phosphonate transport system permease protein
METMRAGGAGRLQMAMYGVLPAALPRFLLYFFYRWETCVREATVLSMLGMVGIGYWIVEADAHDREDLLFLYVLLASGLVLIGDLVSAIARGIVRRA